MSAAETPTTALPNNQEGFNTKEILIALSPGVSATLIQLESPAAWAIYTLPKTNELQTENGHLNKAITDMSKIPEKASAVQPYFATIDDLQSQISTLEQNELSELMRLYKEVKTAHKAIREQVKKNAADPGQKNELSELKRLYKEVKTSRNAIREQVKKSADPTQEINTLRTETLAFLEATKSYKSKYKKIQADQHTLSHALGIRLSDATLSGGEVPKPR